MEYVHISNSILQEDIFKTGLIQHIHTGITPPLFNLTVLPDKSYRNIRFLVVFVQGSQDLQ